MLQVFCGIPPELSPPKGSLKEAKGNQKGAKVTKGSQREPKGSQRSRKRAGEIEKETKWSQKATNRQLKIRLGAKVNFECQKVVSDNVFQELLLIHFYQKVYQKSMHKSLSKKRFIKKRSRKGVKIDAKIHAINTRTGIEKDQGNHQKSCFSEE